MAGALCGAVEDGGSLTGGRCFWIAAPVGGDDAFYLPDSGLFTEYGPDRRERMTQEAGSVYSGHIFVPEDMETVEL